MLEVIAQQIAFGNYLIGSLPPISSRQQYGRIFHLFMAISLRVQGIVSAAFTFLVCSQSLIVHGQDTAPANLDRRHRIAATPPMGWNSWNTFGKLQINERIVREVIDAMVVTGLRDAGYEYVVIDGGWRDTKLGKEGELLPHPERFAHGIKPLADYAHSHGLKIGLHTVPGTHDCIGDPVGGYGREEKHVEQFMDWGIDFVKLDKCRFDGGWTEQRIRATYSKWSQLLRERSDDKLVFSISAYEGFDWYPQICQMARTTEDISAKAGGMSGYHAVFDAVIPEEKNKWGMLSVMQIVEINNRWAAIAGNGYWNDPDMLVTGDQGLSNEEQKSHFALWCIMSAPLMLGNDPRNMTQDEKLIVLNEEAIAIGQDPTEQGTRLTQNGLHEIWAKHLQNEGVAVLLLNREKLNSATFTLALESVGMSGNVRVRDVYAKKDLGTVHDSLSITVDTTASKFLRLSR